MPQDPAKLTTTLTKKKVDELKEQLKARGLPTAGKKADLINRLVEDIIKEEASAVVEEKATQEHEEEPPKNTTAEEEEAQPPAKPEESTESSKSPVKEKSPVRRSPSPSPEPEPVEEKSKDTRSRSESKSPPKQRTPSPQRQEEEGESKDEEQKKRKGTEVQESTSSTNGKRQRKWESRSHNDISISSDTLDNMITDIPQKASSTTNGSSVRSDNVSAARASDTRVVLRREKEKEKDDLPADQRPPVPSSRRPESRTLFIDRFVRPFLPKHAKELLEKTGEVEYFWMNTIRSHCYVTYKTVEQAVATREAIYGLMWPPANKSRLTAEFSSEEEALRRAELAKAREAPLLPTPVQPVSQQPLITSLSRSAEQAVRDSAKERERDRERDKEREREKELRDRERERGRGDRDRDRGDRDRDRVERSGRERERERPAPPPKVTLEQLFRKTVARPCIYWVPLTDKEVEEKKAATIAPKA